MRAQSRPAKRIVAPERGERRRLGIAGERRHRPQQRAEVGVFPRLDAAVRQSAPLEEGERGIAALGDGAGTGAGSRAPPIDRGKLLLRLGLEAARGGGHVHAIPYAAASAKPA